LGAFLFERNSSAFKTGVFQMSDTMDAAKLKGRPLSRWAEDCGFSKNTIRTMFKKGRGPRLIRPLGPTGEPWVSDEAHAEWFHRMTVEEDSEAAKLEADRRSAHMKAIGKLAVQSPDHPVMGPSVRARLAAEAEALRTPAVAKGSKAKQLAGAK
jgi:hypothetical protein